jgi:hypothetical protein
MLDVAAASCAGIACGGLAVDEVPFGFAFGAAAKAGFLPSSRRSMALEASPAQLTLVYPDRINPQICPKPAALHKRLDSL